MERDLRLSRRLLSFAQMVTANDFQDVKTGCRIRQGAHRMLERVFPATDKFTYRGSRIALWLLGLVLFLKIAVGLGAIFNGHYAAAVADGIPIDSYTPQGTQAYLSLFAALGLSQFMLAALGIVLLLKYRPLIPLFLIVLLIDYVARKGLAVYLPVERNGMAPGGIINWALFGIMVLAFVLSIRQGNRVRASSEA